MIIGILSATSLSAFSVYKQDAEYARAETTVRSAITAMTLGELEAPEGFSMAYTSSETNGNPLIGELATMFPSAVVPNEIKLSGEWGDCEAGAIFDKRVVAEPCKGAGYVAWIRTCGGIITYLRNLASSPVC